ncbi:carbamoyltransferase HypF [Streptomyces sp. NPDC056061]|uniref:carbamoyltransferase HypF n=1 Tax=Streptomyces sp. NPDC056061 TaxID=3345700 RepID=UPI0035D62389
MRAPRPESNATAPERRRVTVRGVVQGVGFRPFVFVLARELGLTGHVTNTHRGVVAEIEGAPSAVAVFCDRVRLDAPLSAMVDSVTHQVIPATGTGGFAILPSPAGGHPATFVAPDTATCETCLKELTDPANRRHRHPFLTCTHCGPRFTITTGLPYDRANTTMAAFPMCSDCAREYSDPADRRFHAQPVSCHACGPQLRLLEPGREAAQVTGAEALHRARDLLAAGAVVAVKGLGGYHLACDAEHPQAVRTLRRRKDRGDKPFAVMARDLRDVELLAHLCDAERALLTGRVRPIVLLRRRRGAARPVAAPQLSDAVAPGSPDLGVMFPYTPLHQLLLGLPDDPQGPRLLVMTSGNTAGEPIVTKDQEAVERLSHLAEAWLVHDRPIHAPCDDSVVRVCDGEQLLLRRARGYAPLPLVLPAPVPATLAVGGDLKNVFCLAEGRQAWLSAHVGDMDDLATLEAFERAEGQLEVLTGIKPALLATDRHPGYRSAAWARRNAAGRAVHGVQHHHAHIASAMAEHGLVGDHPVIGVAFDGTGYGDDGAIWGGEVLLADYSGFRRFAQLAYVPLPGGNAAVHRPYRMALAHLYQAGLAWSGDLPCTVACPTEERHLLLRQLQRKLGCVPTSSMGRLFDAVSSLAGVCQRSGYEAQAAIELEAAALGEGGIDERPGYPFVVRPAAARAPTAELIADPAPVLAAAVADLRTDAGPQVIAARFHRGVSDLVRRLCAAARERHGLRTVVLTGGVFANTLLSSACGSGLRQDGFTVLRQHRVPPNDAGLALGQLVVATRAASPPRHPARA